MVVTLDGRLVPAADSGMRVERATGERTLYRELAKVRRSDGGIAGAASRWGLLVLGAPSPATLAPLLAAGFSPVRDEMATAARAWSAGQSGAPFGPMFDAMAGAFGPGQRDRLPSRRPRVRNDPGRSGRAGA